MSYPAVPDYRAFDLRGSHYTIGRTLGGLNPAFAIPSWWPEPPDLDFARQCEAAIAAWHRPLLDEFAGYAEAQGQSYEMLLRILCRRSLRTRTPGGLVPERGGCSSFAWQAWNGHMYVGRNYDFHTFQTIRQRIRLNPDIGYPTIGMRGSVPGGRYDGVNRHGLFVSLHVVMADEPSPVRPGIPFHLVPRILLETCRDVGEAVAAIKALPHLQAFNYLLADPHQMIAIEAYPGRVRRIEPGNRQIAVTNHFRHPDLRPLQRGRNLSHSQTRLAALERPMPDSPDPAPAVLARLRDHPSAVCGHRGGHTTLWSLVADLTARRIAYATGAPCQTALEEVAWPE